jgi:hypothetical protein
LPAGGGEAPSSATDAAALTPQPTPADRGTAGDREGMPGIDGLRRRWGAAAATRRARSTRVGAGLPDEPDYWRLWLVGLVVFGVRWLEMLAVAVFAYQRTRSAFVVALLTMLRILPMTVLGVVIGSRGARRSSSSCSRCC